MIRQIGFLLAVFLITPDAVAGQARDDQAKAVVASRGGVEVTLADLDARMAEIPAESRTETLADPRRMEGIVDDMLLLKQLAREGKEAGTDKDPKYRAALALLTERLLAAFRGDELLKSAPKADAETLARESYTSDAKRFAEPEKLKVRHVLIRTGPGCRTTEMAKALAEKVRDEALAGKDFAELARTYSEDESSRENGGELPAFAHGQMLASFENAAKELEPGAISEVVTTKYGFHVIQFIAREPGREKTYDEVKPQLMKTLAKDHAERYRREHVDQLRSMKLDANPDLVASLPERYAGDAGKAPATPDPNKPLLPKPRPEPATAPDDRN